MTLHAESCLVGVPGSHAAVPEYNEGSKKIGILTLDTPAVSDAYEPFQKVLDAQGLDVTSFQAIAVSLDNVRTYVQPLVDKTETLVLALPVVEIFKEMNVVGYEPEVVPDAGSVFYSLDAVENLGSAPLNAPIYSVATTFPLDRAKDTPQPRSSSNWRGSRSVKRTPLT